MRVLVFIDYYLPGFKGGGPLQSIANMVSLLGEKIDFDIVTRDRDLGDRHPYSNLGAEGWHIVGNARVQYLRPDQYNLSKLRAIMSECRYDWVYLNSFFSPFCGFGPLLARATLGGHKSPLLIAPRGEFAKSALAIKPIKKMIYRKLGHLFGLWSGATWHASTAIEAKEIGNALAVGLGQVRVACDLLRAPPSASYEREAPNPITRQQGGPLKVVFLSRIGPMKNLLFALQVLHDVTVTTEFSIYGPIEDAQYWKACLRAISQLPSHICVDYKDVVPADDVIKTLARHDLFFLPTQGENFGHVIGEALLAGLPLLISDQTPWRDLQSRGIGADIALTNRQAFANYIDRLGRASKTEWDKLSKCVAKEITCLKDQTVAISQNQALFFKAAEPLKANDTLINS